MALFWRAIRSTVVADMPVLRSVCRKPCGSSYMKRERLRMVPSLATTKDSPVSPMPSSRQL